MIGFARRLSTSKAVVSSLKWFIVQTADTLECGNDGGAILSSA
jgi:hypothetical protein